MWMDATMGEELSADERTRYLAPGSFVDSDHADVIAFAEAAIAGADDAVERAVRIYFAVRDDIRYQPYRNFLIPDTYRASVCIRDGLGFCIPKAALVAAAARAVGIPARVGYADVRNHLASRRLLDMIGTDRFIYHGYAALWLEVKWVKSTPAFDIKMCEKFGVVALDFDGREDSLFHPFDRKDRRHMEYVAEHGTFDDVPFERIREAFTALYPHAYISGEGAAGGDLGKEAVAERRD